MEHDEKSGEAASTRGADWEVVSLTASAYAAAPSPEGLDPNDGRKDGNEQESPDAMFMSGHFVFPPSEHENLPIEAEYSGILGGLEDRDVGLVEEGGGGPDETHEEIMQCKPDDDPQGTQFFDNRTSISIPGMDFEEGKELLELNLIGDEQSMHIAPQFSAFHADIDQSESVPRTESSGITKPDDPSNQNLDSSSNYAKHYEEDKYDGSGLPCEAWWKRHAACFYRNAKEANTFWSVFVAAALMGLVVLGRRWQQEKFHLQQLKWKLNISDEKLSRVLGSIGRFKDVLIGGHQRSPTIRGGAFADR